MKLQYPIMEAIEATIPICKPLDSIRCGLCAERAFQYPIQTYIRSFVDSNNSMEIHV